MVANSTSTMIGIMWSLDVISVLTWRPPLRILDQLDVKFLVFSVDIETNALLYRSEMVDFFNKLYKILRCTPLFTYKSERRKCWFLGAMLRDATSQSVRHYNKQVFICLFESAEFSMFCRKNADL